MKKSHFETLSILIPAYNEGGTIAQILQKVVDAQLPHGMRKEIIVVDDCSTDHTADEVAHFSATHPEVNVKCISHEVNRGKGSAVRTAIAAATGEIIIVQDADLEYDPDDYALLIPYITSGKYKVAYGSRVLNKSNQYSYRSFYWGGRLVSVVASLLFGKHITDEPTCYKMFDASLLKSIPLRSDGFGFCPEVTAKVWREGYEIKEVPIRYYPRSVEEGKKIKWYDGISAIGILLRYRLCYTPAQHNTNDEAHNVLPRTSDKMKFYGKKLIWNVLAATMAFAFIYVCYQNYPTYKWVYHTLLLDNYKVARTNKHLSVDQRRAVKLGFNYRYLMTVKQGTPENAVLWMPDSEAYFVGETPYFDRQITSKMYRLRVLYPRKIVDASDKNSAYANRITHVAIINGRGYDMLNYTPDEKPDFAIFPMRNKPKDAH